MNMWAESVNGRGTSKNVGGVKYTSVTYDYTSVQYTIIPMHQCNT